MEMPEDKEYSTTLRFSGNIYEDTFIYEGESYTIKKAYSVTFSPEAERGRGGPLGKIRISESLDKKWNPDGPI